VLVENFFSLEVIIEQLPSPINIVISVAVIAIASSKKTNKSHDKTGAKK